MLTPAVKLKPLTPLIIFPPVPRGGPRNMRVYDPTTTTLSVSWEHALGPVTQYRITYAQTTGDPIEEYVSILPKHSSFLWCGSCTVAINKVFFLSIIYVL